MPTCPKEAITYYKRVLDMRPGDYECTLSRFSAVAQVSIVTGGLHRGHREGRKRRFARAGFRFVCAAASASCMYPACQIVWRAGGVDLMVIESKWRQYAAVEMWAVQAQCESLCVCRNTALQKQA